MNPDDIRLKITDDGLVVDRPTPKCSFCLDALDGPYVEIVASRFATTVFIDEVPHQVVNDASRPWVACVTCDELLHAGALAKLMRVAVARQRVNGHAWSALVVDPSYRSEIVALWGRLADHVVERRRVTG